jgi:hypothetical protein
VADNLGSVGAAYLDIKARVDKGDIDAKAKEAQAELSAKLQEESESRQSILPTSHPALTPQQRLQRKNEGTARAYAQEEIDRQRFEAEKAAKEKAHPELGHFWPGAQSSFYPRASEGQDILRQQVAERHRADAESKKALEGRLNKESGDFAHNLGKANDELETSRGGIAGIFSRLGFGGNLALGGLSTILGGIIKANKDFAGYRQDAQAVSPMLAFQQEQLGRDVTGTRGREMLPASRMAYEQDRAAADAREFWRLQRAQGNKPSVLNPIRWEQDWREVSRVVGTTWSTIKNWAIGANEIPSAFKGASLGAGGFAPGAFQNYGGPVELIQAAQQAASMSWRGTAGETALDANTQALNKLHDRIAALDRTPMSEQGPAYHRQRHGLVMEAIEIREKMGPMGN